MDENDFYYPNEVENEYATFFGVNLKDLELDLPNSQEKIDTFIADQKAQNTVRKTKSDLNILYKFLQTSCNGHKVIEHLPPEELNHLLCKFFMEIKKADGSNYEPNTLSSYQRSIQRHLQEHSYPANILKDEVFEKSRKVLQARRKSLVQAGKGNRPESTRAITTEEEDLLFSSGQFGDKDPEALQRALWWQISLHFGFRARDECRKLRWGDVQLQKTNDGHEVLVCLGERGTKTRSGQEKGHQRAFQSKAYATNDERCPVMFYKEFKQHRPA